MAQDDFENTDASGIPDVTQVFGAVGEASLQESLAQLGPRTTTHGTAATSTTPSFAEWVDKWVADHVPTAMAKAQQYGSNSLAKKGHRFAAVGSRDLTGYDQALELGTAQYIVEKADRVEDAILRGHLPSSDTYVDLAVYSLMALYIRQHGRW